MTTPGSARTCPPALPVTRGTATRLVMALAIRLVTNVLRIGAPIMLAVSTAIMLGRMDGGNP
jgi:hypothetical protein